MGLVRCYARASVWIHAGSFLLLFLTFSDPIHDLLLPLPLFQTQEEKRIFSV